MPPVRPPDERLIDALRLCASGVAIENLAGDDVEKLAAPFKHRARSAGGRRHHPILRGASSPRDSVRDRLSATAMARYGFAPIHLRAQAFAIVSAHQAMRLAVARILRASTYTAEPGPAIRIGMAP